MHFSITGRHLVITHALRDYTEQRIQKLQKYVTRSIEANIVLSVEKHRHMAEVLINVDGQRMLAKEETHEMYQSIDRAVATIEKRFKKYKDKRITHNKEKISLRESLSSAYGVKSEALKIQRKRPYRVNTLSFEDAVKRLLSMTPPQFIFIDESDRKLKILNKRQDKQIECMELVLE